MQLMMRQPSNPPRSSSVFAISHISSLIVCELEGSLRPVSGSIKWVERR